MKVGVIGSRTFNDYNLLKRIMRSVITSVPLESEYDLESEEWIQVPITIISGGAKGADQLVEKWQKERINVPSTEMKVFKPQYDKYPVHIAPLKRNDEIVEAADIVVAFIVDNSRGTRYTIDKALKANKPVFIIPNGKCSL